MSVEEDFQDGNGRAKPKVGYRCKICGKEGGQEDSHWYQLCPMKGYDVLSKSLFSKTEERTFNPPKKGYVCKFCHKQGGESDSHWFQQCPNRKFFSGVQVPHPLNTGNNQQFFNMTVATQALAMLPATNQTQIQYTRQISATGMNIVLYPQYQTPVNQQHLLAMQQYAQQQQQYIMQNNANQALARQPQEMGQQRFSLDYLSETVPRSSQKSTLKTEESLLDSKIDQNSVLNFIDSRGDTS